MRRTRRSWTGRPSFRPVAEPAAGASGNAALGLRFGTLALRAESDDAGHLAWLREFLTPAFEVVEPPATGRLIRVRTNRDAYAAAVDRGPGTETVPCFWLDTGVLRLPAWTASTPGERILFDADARVFYRLNGAAGIELLASGEGRGVRDALMRVVRELATIDLRRAGGLVLHCAALARGDRVLLIAGPKGAGKTTLLVHLLRAPETRVVANDRAAIPAAGPPAVRGLPTIVKLLRTSADWLPGLAERLDASRYHHGLTLAEVERRPTPTAPGSPRETFSLSPAQLCALLGSALAPGGRLAALVFPRPRAVAGAIAVRRLPAVEAAAAIRTAQLGSLIAPALGVPAAVEADPWTAEGPVSAGALARAAARIEELAAVVPAYACDLGPRAYADPAAAGRLLGELGL